jgi:hypothetical protein
MISELGQKNIRLNGRMDCDRLLKTIATVARALTEHQWESSVPLILHHLKNLQAVRASLTEHIVAGEGPDKLLNYIVEGTPRLQRQADQNCGQDIQLPRLLEELETKLKGYIPSRPAGGAREIRRTAAFILRKMQEHDAVATFLLLETHNTDIGLGG